MLALTVLFFVLCGIVLVFFGLLGVLFSVSISGHTCVICWFLPQLFLCVYVLLRGESAVCFFHASNLSQHEVVKVVFAAGDCSYCRHSDAPHRLQLLYDRCLCHRRSRFARIYVPHTSAAGLICCEGCARRGPLGGVEYRRSKP